MTSPNGAPLSHRREVSRVSRPPLSDWEQALEAIELCPYVGPRPQDAADAGMLIGREQDLAEIARKVLDFPLVVLDGLSGSGKSSLLQNGLVERLGKKGFQVLVSREWQPLDSLDGAKDEYELDTLIEKYIAKCILATNQRAKPQIKSPDNVPLEELQQTGGLCDLLDDQYGSSAILILDQFEELLRQPHEDKARRAQSIVEWIVRHGHRHKAHIVLSLRTDSLHLLNPFLRGIRPFLKDAYTVEELKERECIREVIRRYRCWSDDPVQTKETVEILDENDPVVTRLMELWDTHRPKLLNLQATLYTLYFRTRDRGQDSQVPTCAADAEGGAGGVRIDEAAVLSLVSDAKKHSDIDPFTLGLREAVRLKIEHAEQAARQEDLDLDPYLVWGAQEIVRRIAPILSSGDFKVPVKDTEVAKRVLGRESRILKATITQELGWRQKDDGTQRGLIATLFDSLHGHDILSAPFEAVGLPDNYVVQIDAAARTQVTAGPMMLRSATQTMFEEARRVAFAIEWLIATGIVRKDADGTLLLVHDGAGGALTDWARADDVEPNQALHRLTGSRGEHFDWSDHWIGTAPGSDSEQLTVLTNVNWRDCRITVGFRKVVFVNCDFRGSQFVECTFDGATFVNCILDDANFEYCTVSGATGLAAIVPEKNRDGQVRLAPSFTVEARRGDVAAFHPYLERVEPDSGTHQFFSDTSGAPARPGTHPPDFQGDYLAHFMLGGEPSTSQLPARVVPAKGGVAMFGGRLCFLTLYKCSSEDGGSFALHHVSGDGLYVVEQDGVDIDVNGGVIRGVSVSRDTESSSASGTPALSRPIQLGFRNSFVQNVYFSDGLDGLAAFTNCVVLMLVNANQPPDDAGSEGFSATLDDCRYQCVINVDLVGERGSAEDSTADTRDVNDDTRYFTRVADPDIPGEESRYRIVHHDVIASNLSAMDYRFRPEAFEHNKRKKMAGQNRTIEGDS